MSEIERYRPIGLDDRLRYAQLMAQADLLPQAYQEKPANVLLIMDYGDSLGLPYSQAISLINIMDGKPTASAALISAMVRKAGHRLRIVCDTEALTATATIIRADDPDFPFEATWTVARAAAAGLCSVNEDGTPHARSFKGKPTAWEKYTVALLKARAITEVAREACQEALMGIQYTPEEIGASVDADGEPIGTELVQIEPPASTPTPQAQSAGDDPVPAEGTTKPEAEPEARKTATTRSKARATKPASVKPEPTSAPEPAPAPPADQATLDSTDQATPEQPDQAPPPADDEDEVDWGNYWAIRLAQAEEEHNMEQIQQLATEAKDHGATDLVEESQEAWRRSAAARKNGN